MKSKKITKNGSITIPKEMRGLSGLYPGVGVDIVQQGETVTIKPHVPVCCFCGNPERVTHVKNIDICADCAAQIHEAVVNNG